MKKIILASVCIFCLSSNLFAYTESDFVWDFEWLENNNTIEIALNEPYQLKYRCSSNYDIVFTSDMADNWIHYDLNNGQSIVDPPTAYSISSSGVITGLKVGKYAMKFTGLIQPKSGADKWLYINIVSEKREVESNNTLDTANEFTKKIRFGLSNISDVDYFKCKHDASFGERVKFKLHYYGSNSNPFGYKWAAFSGTDKQQVATGSLNNQDQECSAMITSGDYVYFEVYFNQSQSQYFNYGDEFTLEFLGKDENIKATSIILDKTTLDIALGKQQNLTATILPENATNKSIKWSSSNESVAKVTDGLVTALSVGTTTITASTNDGSNLNAQCTVTVYDAKQKCGSNAYWSFDSATGLLSITGSGKMTNYSSSSNVPWYKYRNDITSLSIGDQITSIGEKAFYKCSGLTSVTIPNSVTEISYCAFWGCSGLTSVTIPNSMTSIGGLAFRDCFGLTSVVINIVDWANKNVVATYSDLSGKPFSYTCNGNKIEGDYIIPDSVTTIGNYALYKCKDITKLTIPNSVTSIDDRAFYGCSGLTSVTIGNSVTSIDDRAFYGCSSLTSVTIPNSVTSIGDYAFSDCTGLTSVNITNLDKWAEIEFGNGNANPLYYAHNLYLNGQLVTNAELTTAKKIDDYAFYNCTGLTSVTIPNSVTSIGNYAFYGCSGLTSVTIGNSVTSIGSSAFEGCSNVKELIYAEGTKTILQTGLTSITDVTIPNSVTSIGSSAFEGCSGLASVTIPNSVTSIGAYAFSGCSGLTSVTIPNSVTSIGSSAFSGCSGLTSVTIPNSVTSIGSSAFSGCSGLTSVTIPNSVTSIGSSAFSGCSGLTSVVINIVGWANKNVVATYSNLSGKPFSYTCNGNKIEGDYIIPDSVTTIGNYALYKCKDITKLTIPNSVTSIDDRAFYGCSGLTSVTIGNSVTSIGSYAFADCSGLTSVTIGNSVTSIGSYAFADCSGLTSVNITDLDKWAEIEFGCDDANPLYYAHNLYLNGQLVTEAKLTTAKKIGDYAFYGCSGLTSVTIPNSVTSIGVCTFSGCSGLTSVKVHWKRPLSIGSNVWNGVDKQKCTLYVPEGTWTMYCAAPVWMDFVNIEEFSDEPGEEIYLTVMGVNGVILQQAVEMGRTYKYLLDNKNNGKIVAVTFNGEDVTTDVTDGKYTTPKITGNSEIYVEYDNQPLGDTNLDGNVNVNDITATAEIILLRAKAEMEAKAAMKATAEP